MSGSLKINTHIRISYRASFIMNFLINKGNCLPKPQRKKNLGIYAIEL